MQKLVVERQRLSGETQEGEDDDDVDRENEKPLCATK